MTCALYMTRMVNRRMQFLGAMLMLALLAHAPLLSQSPAQVNLGRPAISHFSQKQESQPRESPKLSGILESVQLLRQPLLVSD